jgi:signal transduction histidine kinase
MTIGGQVTGVISIQSLEREHAFDQDHLRLLSTVASQAAVAIENAKLYAERTHAWQEAKDEAIAAERERIEAEKWAYLGRVAGSLAHRIGNKGGMIRLCVQDLEELLASLDLQGNTLLEATEYLDTIRRNNRYLLSLSNFLFKPRKAMEETRDRTDVHKYLEDALKYAEIPAGVQVERHFENNLLPVLGNKYLVEVFLELIINGVEAVEPAPEKNLSITTAQADKQWIEICFRDTGPGIAPEDKDFVFELFAQASDKKLSEEGHQGFGLWWVRMFLREIGGDVSVESEPGRGSTFIVRLPVAEAQSER